MSIEAPGHYIPIYGMWDDGTLLNYCGDCTVVLGLGGLDFETADEQKVDSVTKTVEQAKRVFGHEYRIYEYFSRRAEGRFYRNDLFMAVLKMGPPLKARGLSSAQYKAAVLESAVQTKAAVNGAVVAFEQILRGVIGCRRLGVEETFGALCRVNYEPSSFLPRQPVMPVYIGNQILSSNVEACNRGDGIGHHLRIDDVFMKVLTLSELGSATFPTMFQQLRQVKGEFSLCSEWNVLREGKGVVDRTRDIINNFKASGALSMSARKTDTKRLNDQGDEKAVSVLGDTQERLWEGEVVGDFSLTAIVYGRNQVELERTQQEVEHSLALVDCKARPETANQLGAWLATIPGNYTYQVRRLKILDKNFADLGLWQSPMTGNPVNEHLGAPALMTMATREGTPFHVNLHFGGVGDILVLGDTETGKSYLNNAIVRSVRKTYKGRVTIFDKGGSYRWTVAELGGAYLRLSPMERCQEFTLNPFQCVPTKAKVDYLTLLAQVLMEYRSQPLTAGQLKTVHQRVGEMFNPEIPGCERRLSLLADMLCSLGERLQMWVEGGQYGWMFDNREDTLTMNEVQCFEFEGTGNREQAGPLEPMVLHLMHRTIEEGCDVNFLGQLKYVLLGELHGMLHNPSIKAGVEEMLRTGRKYNVAVGLETQSPLELMKSGLAEVILGACQTRFYLTSNIDYKTYGEWLELSPKKLEIIAGLTPKSEVFYDQPRSGISKVFVMQQDEEGHWLSAKDPRSDLIRARAIEKCGEDVQQWLPELVGANGGRG